MEDPIYIPLLSKEDEELEEEIKTNIKNKIHKGFIWKVFCILLYQLTITSLMVIIAMTSSTISEFIRSNNIIYFAAIIISITCILLSLCSPALYKKIPINYILLTIFTICNGYLISSLTIISNPLNVTVAFILTFVTVIALTIYAWKSETDFTIYGGVLCSFLAMLVIGSLIMIFFTVSLIVLIIYICLSLCLAFYLVYDVQLLIGNKRNKFDEEDYILATINLYLDIVNIFINLLRLINIIRSD